MAADITWDPAAATTDWTTAANWTGGVAPGGGDNAVVNNTAGNTPVVNNSPGAVSDVWIGNGGGNSGIVSVETGGKLTSNNWFVVGRGGGTGTLNMSGGEISNGGGSFIVSAGGTGTLTQTGGSITSTSRVWISENGNATATVTNGILSAGAELEIGRGGTGTLTVNAGSTVSSGANFIVGNGGTGNLNVNTGASVSSGNGEFWVGQGGGATGTLTQTGGQIVTNNWTVIGRENSTGNYVMSGGSLTKSGGGSFIIGDNSTGTVTQTGGTIGSGGSEYWIGQGSKTSSHSISNGALNVGNWLAIGRNGGTGSLTVSATGVVTKTGGGQFTVGSNGTGTMTVSGNGIVDVQSGNLFIGESGSASSSLTISDSAQVNAVKVILGVSGTTTGTANFNGGTLRTSWITSGIASDGNPVDPDNSATTTANVNFNGTQIIATDNNAAFISKLDSAVIGTGGLKIDSNGKTLATAQAFTGSGGVTKSGAGSLDLSANSSFGGAVVVTAGTLFVNGNLSGTTGATVSGSSTLGGGGSIAGSTVVGSGASIAPGNSVGTLSLGSLNLQSGSTYIAELSGNGVNDQLNVSGALAANGMIQILLSYTPVVGDSFDLANFTSFSGTPTFDFAGSAGLLTWDTTQFGTTGVVSVTAVPETSAALLGALGSLVLLRRRRR